MDWASLFERKPRFARTAHQKPGKKSKRKKDSSLCHLMTVT